MHRKQLIIFWTLSIFMPCFGNINIIIPDNEMNDQQNIGLWTSIDSTLQANVGEMAANVILNADSVKVAIIPFDDVELPAKCLHHWMQRHVQYVLCQPTMYQSNKKVYSAFMADAFMTFTAGKDNVTIELDYNIFKWRLINANNEELCRHDLFACDFLPMLYMLFPESKLLLIKYEKYMEKYEK